MAQSQQMAAARQQPQQQTTGVSAHDVPERPRLAPGVELRGEMEETGFQQKQFLVQRDGSFVQLTELLFRVAEQATGDQTLDQMAQRVSESFGKKVSADNVRQLLQTKLIPMGLVVKADGSVVKPQAGAAARARSPLAVNMRMRMVSPRLIEPVTNVLKHLYHPAILVPILLVATAAHIWLYAVHGIAQGARSMMYNPSLMLVLIGLVVASAAFHEFGHAAALHYGGGKVGGMGVGLYIVYPAFYTDVTDNYRLGRWARVRTDLGGFYFNLIFELALIGLYFATGAEVLLVAVLLLDLEIVHQMLPFVRLDGYWALADMTGIPDFFSHIGPFLRTVLPLPWWKGRKLPGLKGWVKVVFALYILITVPLLLLLLFLMVKSVPRILATAWDAAGKQMEALSAAQATGDVFGVGVSALQIALLALPALGILYSLYMLGRRFFTALWNWSKPTPARRFAGSVIGMGLVTGLAYLWTPQLPFGGTSGPLYQYTQKNFRPIQPAERGTLVEAVAPSGRLFGFFGGAAEPTATATPTASPSPTPAPGTGTTATPAATVSPTPGARTPSPTITPAVLPTSDPGIAPTGAPAATATPRPSLSSTATPANNPDPTATPASQDPDPTSTPVEQSTPTATPEIEPTSTPGGTSPGGQTGLTTPTSTP